jgi:hypothetical protein
VSASLLQRPIWTRSPASCGLAILLSYAAALFSGSHALAEEPFVFIFAEGGIVEGLSLALWLFLGCLVILSRRVMAPPVSLAAAALCLLAAAREADWHNFFTGTSVFKVSYYLDQGVAPAERVVVAALLFAAASAGAWLAVRMIRHVRESELVDSHLFFLFAAMALLPATKVLDQAPAILRKDVGIILTDEANHALTALEEGLELAIPLLLLFALLTASSRPVRRGSMLSDHGNA